VQVAIKISEKVKQVLNAIIPQPTPKPVETVPFPKLGLAKLKDDRVMAALLDLSAHPLDLRCLFIINKEKGNRYRVLDFSAHSQTMTLQPETVTLIAGTQLTVDKDPFTMRYVHMLEGQYLPEWQAAPVVPEMPKLEDIGF
jgi:hypothetical protein